MMDEVEEFLAKTEPQLDDGTLIPSRQVEGWTHMAVAVAKLADSFLLGEHTWQDIFSHACTVADRPDEEWSRYVAQGFVDSCRLEHLRTAYRPRAGGGLTDIPSEWWELDDIMLRFRSYGIDPSEPFSDAIPPPCWIWVESASLDAACNVLRRRKYRNNGEPKLIPMGGQFDGVFDAIEFLRPFLPEITGPISPQGAPEGAAELLNLLRVGRVHGIAGTMTRSFSRAGETAKIVEQRQDWQVPPAVWKGVELSPEQDWTGGRFVSRPDERNTYELGNVAIVGDDLDSYVDAMGVAARIQFRARVDENMAAIVECRVPFGVAAELETALDAAELEAALAEEEARQCEPAPKPPRRKYNNRLPSTEQREAFRFFEAATAHLRDGSRPMSQEDLHAFYKKQFGKESRMRLQGGELGLTQFKEMLRRFYLGDRIVSGRWSEKTD